MEATETQAEFDREDAKLFRLMRKGGPFGRATAYVAMAAGLFGVVAVLGALAWEPLGRVIIPGSLLSGIWFFLVGYRLWRLGAAVGNTSTSSR